MSRSKEITIRELTGDDGVQVIQIAESLPEWFVGSGCPKEIRIRKQVARQ